MDTRPKTIYLPDTMVDWPWPRTNVKAEADAWFRDFKALTPKSQEAFDKCEFEYLRIGCDLMNVFFIFDDYTDVQNEAVTKEIVDIMLDALHNPQKMRPEGEHILGEIVRQFWARTIQSASLSSQRHFLETFTAYLHAVVTEVIDREQGHSKRSIDDYLKLRRYTSGVKPTYSIVEMGMDLPDEVFYNPVIMELAECITDIALIDNDMISYNKEQAAGNEDHNIVSTVMLELGLDRGGAMAWAANYHAEAQKRFIDGLAKVPSWGPSIDVLVKEYLDGMAMFVRGHKSWGYEGHRYCGTRGPEIQQTRLVPLLPKANLIEVGV
ncbi:terpenoid synthase [Suillus subluteus]|nr:terpenoid synthase [Suillus subluteus]